MAAQRIRKRTSNIADQRDNLRKTVRKLLHKVEAKPVPIDSENGIDFYEVVSRFEAQLIESALEATGGRQNRAAGLLKLRKSTLNAKMKALKLR